MRPVGNFFSNLARILSAAYDRYENRRRYEEERTLAESNFIRQYALQQEQNLLEGIASYKAMGNDAAAQQLQASLGELQQIITEPDPVKRTALYNDFNTRQKTLSPGTVTNPQQIYQALPFAPTVTRPSGLQMTPEGQQPVLDAGGVQWPQGAEPAPTGAPIVQATGSDYLRSLASMQPGGVAPTLQFPGAAENVPTVAANIQARSVNQPFGFASLAAAGPKLLEQRNILNQANLARELQGLKPQEVGDYSEGFYELARFNNQFMTADGKDYDWSKVAASGLYTPKEIETLRKNPKTYLPSTTTKAAEEGKLPQGVVLAFGQMSDNLNSIRESYRSNNIPLPAQFSRASALLSAMFSKEKYDPAAVDAINQLIDEATIILGSKISAQKDEELRKNRQIRSEEATLERHKQVGIELQLLRGAVAYKKRDLTAEEQKLIDSYNALGTAPDPQKFDAWLTQNAMALTDANVFAENAAFDRSFERIIKQTQATTNIQTAAEQTLLRTKADLDEEAAIKEAGRRVSEILLNKTVQQDLAKYSQGLNLETLQVQLQNTLRQIEVSGTVDQRNTAIRQAQEKIDQLELIGARAKVDSDARVQQSGLNLAELAAQLKGQLSNTLTTMKAQAGYNAQSDERQLANRLTEIAATQSGNLKNELTTIGAQLSSSLTQLERSSDLQARNTAASQAQAKIDEIDILIRKFELSENAADKQLARELITIREQASLNLNSQLTLQKSGADLNRLATNQQEANAIKTEGTKELGLLISKARQVFGADKQRQVITPEVLAMQQELIAVKDEVGLSKWQAKYLPLMDELRGTVAAQADVYARTERQGDILFQKSIQTDLDAIAWANDMRNDFTKLFRDVGLVGESIPDDILEAFAEAAAITTQKGKAAWDGKWLKRLASYSAQIAGKAGSYTLKTQKELEKYSVDLRAGDKVEAIATERYDALLNMAAKGAEAGYVLSDAERRAISALGAVNTATEWNAWKATYGGEVASIYENVGKAIAKTGELKLSRAENFQKEMLELQKLSEKDLLVLGDSLTTARLNLQRTWQVADIKNENDRDDRIRLANQAFQLGIIKTEDELKRRILAIQNGFEETMIDKRHKQALELAGVSVQNQKELMSFGKLLNSDAEVLDWKTKHLDLLSSRALAAGRAGLVVPSTLQDAIAALANVTDTKGQNDWVRTYGPDMVVFAGKVGEQEKNYDKELENGRVSKNLAANQLTRLQNAFDNSPGISNEPIYQEALSALTQVINGSDAVAPRLMSEWISKYGNLGIQIASAGLTAKELSERNINRLNNTQSLAAAQLKRLNNVIDGASEEGVNLTPYQTKINEAIALIQEVMTAENGNDASKISKNLELKLNPLVNELLKNLGETRRAADAKLLQEERTWRSNESQLNRDHSDRLTKAQQDFDKMMKDGQIPIDPIIAQLPYLLASLGKIGGGAGTNGEKAVVSYRVVGNMVQDVQFDVEAFLNLEQAQGLSEDRKNLLRSKSLDVTVGLVRALQNFEDNKRKATEDASNDPLTVYRVQVAPAADQFMNSLTKVAELYAKYNLPIPKSVADAQAQIYEALSAQPPTFEANARVMKVIGSNPNLFVTELNNLNEIGRVRDLIDKVPMGNLRTELENRWKASIDAKQPLRIDASFISLINSMTNEAELLDQLSTIADRPDAFATMLQFKWVNPDGTLSSNAPEEVRKAWFKLPLPKRAALTNAQSLRSSNFTLASKKLGNLLQSMGTDSAKFISEFNAEISRLDGISPETATDKDIEDYNKLTSSAYKYWAFNQVRNKNLTLLENVLRLSADSGIPLSEAEVASIAGATDPSTAISVMNRIVSTSLTKAQERTDLASKVESLASFRKNVADPIKDYLFSIPDNQLTDQQRALREQIAQLTIIDYTNEKASNDVITSALMAAKANPALAEAIAAVHKQSAELDKVQLDTLKANLASLQGDEATIKSQQYEKLVNAIDGNPASFAYITALKEQGLIDDSQYESLAKYHKTLAPLYAADLKAEQQTKLLKLVDVTKNFLPIRANGSIISPDNTAEWNASVRGPLVQALTLAARELNMTEDQILSAQRYLTRAQEANARALIASNSNESAVEQRRQAEHNMRMAQGQLTLQSTLLTIQGKQMDLQAMRQRQLNGEKIDEAYVTRVQAQYNTTIDNYQQQVTSLKASIASLNIQLQLEGCMMPGINQVDLSKPNCAKIADTIATESQQIAAVQQQADKVVAQANATVGALLTGAGKPTRFTFDPNLSLTQEQIEIAADEITPSYTALFKANPSLATQLSKAVKDYRAATEQLEKFNVVGPAQSKESRVSLQTKQQQASAAINEIARQIGIDPGTADQKIFTYWALQYGQLYLPTPAGSNQPGGSTPAASRPASSKPATPPAKPSYVPTNTKAPGYSAAYAWRDILTGQQINTILAIANDPAKIKQFLGTGTRPTLAGRPLTEAELKDIAAYYRVSGPDLAKLMNK